MRCAAPGHDPQDCNAQAIAVITAPNPGLKPEQSKSYTAGFVLDPTPNTSLTLDAFKIKRTDEIFAGDTDAAIAARGPNVIRGTNAIPGTPNSGSILAVLVGYENASATTVRGFDFDARQRFDLGGAGQLKLDLQWTRINSLERVNADGSKSEFAGTHGDCNVTNCIGTPKDRANFGATWDVGQVSLSTVDNWRASIDNTPERGAPCSNTFADGATPAPKGCKLDSFYSIDLSGRWHPTEAFEVFGSIANVTDRIAPLDPVTYGAVGYDPLDFCGAIGRYYTIGVKYTFK